MGFAEPAGYSTPLRSARNDKPVFVDLLSKKVRGVNPSGGVAFTGAKLYCYD